MAFQKAGLMKAKVTMVCTPPPTTTERGGLCNSMAYVCGSGAYQESVRRTWKPQYQLVNHAENRISVARRSYTQKKKEVIFGPCLDHFEFKGAMGHSC